MQNTSVAISLNYYKSFLKLKHYNVDYWPLRHLDILSEKKEGDKYPPLCLAA